MDEKLLADFEIFCATHNIKPKDFLYELKASQAEQQDEDIKKWVELNKELVGNCYTNIIKPMSGMFPETKRYYKVISERASSKYEVSCLVFSEEPYYWFDYQSHKIHMPGDYFFGRFDFSSIWIEERLIKDLPVTRVSEPVFQTKMIALIEKINKMPWVADHYKYGDIWPSDERWCKNDE